MKNKEVLVLAVAALVLLVLAYVLSRSSAESLARGDAGPADARRRAPVVYPRDTPRPTSGGLATDRGPATPETRARLDAMQRALLGGESQSAIFIEANAIRHSPLVEKILRCREQDSALGLAEIKKEIGIDPTEDLDRVGFDGDVFVASGFFENLKVPAELGEGKPYGKEGRLWTEEDAEGKKVVFARLGNGMFMSADDEAKVQAAIDRAEGAAGVTEPPSLPPGFGQGEVYGTVGADFIERLISGSPDAQVKNLAKLVSTSTVRMLVDEDAALSLDLQSPDDNSAKDLGAMLEAGLTLLRSDAEKSGDREFAALLEQARVQRGGDGRINFDLAVPGAVLLKGMGCGPDGTPLPTPAGPQGPAQRPGLDGDEQAPAPPP